MSLRTLPAKLSLQGKRVLLRLDWNIPLAGQMAAAESLKIERSLATIHDLSQRGAIVIILTHLGRPSGRDRKFSTRQLLPLLEYYDAFDLQFHPQAIGDALSRQRLGQTLMQASAGSIHLLENVRFEAGEEKNSLSLAKAYATLGDAFVNDAFASCHRSHVSVVGIAKQLPAYAGPALAAEVKALSCLFKQPRAPFLAFIGGGKVSTKLQVLRALLPLCDGLYIGGAMATTLLAAKNAPTGASFVESSMLKRLGNLLTAKKVHLPIDVAVVKRPEIEERPRNVLIGDVADDDHVVDVGPRTLRAWAMDIQQAKTVLWNGPVGVSEVHAYAAGSRFLARAIGARAKGPAFGVAGGGDTLPIIMATKTSHWFDHVSTGGGALLEFLAKKGKLPGLLPLEKE